LNRFLFNQDISAQKFLKNCSIIVHTLARPQHKIESKFSTHRISFSLCFGKANYSPFAWTPRANSDLWLKYVFALWLQHTWDWLRLLQRWLPLKKP
jgi:hypothetical protein